MAAIALLALFAGAAILGFSYSLIRLASGEDLALVELALQVGLGVLLCALVWYFLQALAQRSAIEELARDGELPLKKKVHHYEAVISLVAFSLRLRTSYLLGKERSFSGLLLCQILTFLGGWWAFPMGPIDTIRTLVRNQRGGYQSRISNLAARAPEKTAQQ